MASVFIVRIQAVVTNGPYAYTVLKNGSGVIDRNGQADISTALTNAKNDVGANLAGELVTDVMMTVRSA